MSHIRSALDLKVRPSAHILLHKNPHSGWTRWDHLLAVAYSQLNAEMCDKCGNPTWLCRTTDDRVRFEVNTYVCYADKELQKRRKKREERKKELRDGEYEYVRAVPDKKDDVLPSRDDYYDLLSKKDDSVDAGETAR